MCGYNGYFSIDSKEMSDVNIHEYHLNVLV